MMLTMMVMRVYEGDEEEDRLVMPRPWFFWFRSKALKMVMKCVKASSAPMMMAMVFRGL